MINLTNAIPFAEGGNRKCFVHPEDKNKCVKVINAESFDKRINNLPWYKRFKDNSAFDDNLKEEKGYLQHALIDQDSKKWKHIAKWYGIVETTIGPGAVTELIRNNGEIAITLEQYLFKDGLTPEVKLAIENFHDWLRETLVLTKNLIPHNLVLKIDNGEIIIKIIDGLGSKSFIPLPNKSNFFAKQYVERRIQLMWSRINWDLSGRKGNWK